MKNEKEIKSLSPAWNMGFAWLDICALVDILFGYTDNFDESLKI